MMMSFQKNYFICIANMVWTRSKHLFGWDFNFFYRWYEEIINLLKANIGACRMIDIAKVHAIYFGVELAFRNTSIIIIIEVKLRDQNQLKELL